MGFLNEHESMAARLDGVLPQTQCRQCGHAGCRPYAEALVRGEAEINQCPPGGEAGVRALARILRVEYKPLNPAYGRPKPKARAVIDEAECIGCTLCLEACPVDAILGAGKRMHTVIAPECTGCELCVAPCPVDCIRMVPVADETISAGQARAAADLARQRHALHQARPPARRRADAATRAADAARKARQAAIAAAVARVADRRARMNAKGSGR